jgi:hypothetical protein
VIVAKKADPGQAMMHGMAVAVASASLMIHIHMLTHNLIVIVI